MARDDADLVIQSTESFRGAGGARATWSNNYVYLGGNGGEESYFLDVGHTPAPILVYAYESGTVVPRCANLAGWLADLRGELEAIAADEREMNARYHGKRWWQFWIRPYPPHDPPSDGR